MSILTTQLITASLPSSVFLPVLSVLFLAVIFLLIKNYRLNRELLEAKHLQLQQLAKAEELEKAASRPDPEHRNKSTFLSNMNHEIRTPMNAILGFTSLLQQKTTDPESLGYLSSIAQSGDILLKLISDIIDLSKMESGNLKINLSPTDLQRVLNEIAHMFSAKLSRKGLTLSVEASEDLPSSLLIDESRVRQILFNLVSNAIKHTTAGQISLKATSIPCPALAGSHQLIIEVSDSGCGIPLDVQKTIFSSSSHSSPEKKVGLGLPLSKSLAEAMNGSLTLTSSPEGSTFTLTFDEVKANLNGVDYSTKRSPFPVNFTPPTILVADDIKLNRELTRKYLAPLKPRLLEATNGSEALDLARAYGPDLILMDIKMPVMNGYEASKRLRQEAATRCIPIVAICASIDDSEVGGNKDINDFLLKPVTQLQMLKIVRKHLPHHFEGEGLQANFTEQELKYEIKEISELEELQNKLIALQEKCENLKVSKSINEIEIFSQQIKEIATRHNCIKLYVWGEYLEIKAASFEITNLSQALEKFPDMINELQNISDSVN